ncbi:9212_t:CDS:2 [Ambispora leptoticha]|uniref:9212_t:CDS:1 n=1 Tax=Ambispora leptoticha TaxID=144679 RepID=A0A9N9FR25_9GLOM|nr:9212_t:CDS:2 [Ambispora leptoticha]
MESSELVKRLSLLEDQRNLILGSIYTANGIANGTIKGSQDGSYTTHEDIQTEKLTPLSMVNAEGTISETISWNVFDLRVHHLEKSVYGFDPVTKKAVPPVATTKKTTPPTPLTPPNNDNPPTTTNVDKENNTENNKETKTQQDKLNETLSLLRRVDEVKKQFQTIIRERDGLKSFLEQYDQVSEFVSPFKDAVDMERAILTTEAKAEIIVASEEELSALAENYKQIEELQKIIDSEEFKGLDRFFPLLTPIETSHVNQAARTNEVSARITHLLDRYNGIINTLSEIFIAWDSILTIIDAEISALERTKARE